MAAQSRRKVLIFPMAVFAFGDPLDGCSEPLACRFRAIGIGDPRKILPFAAWVERRKCGLGFLILLQSGRELREHFDRRYFDLRHVASRRDRTRIVSSADEACRLPDPTQRLFVRRQVFDANHPSERAPTVLAQPARSPHGSADLLVPEAGATVLLACRHEAENHASVQEKWAASLHHFLDPGAARVDEFADGSQDRLREGPGLRDAGVYFGVQTLRNDRVQLPVLEDGIVERKGRKCLHFFGGFDS